MLPWLCVVHITSLKTALEVISHAITSSLTHGSKEQQPFYRNTLHCSCIRKKSRNVVTKQNGVPGWLQHALTRSTAALWISNKLENSCRLAPLTHQLYPLIIHRSMLLFKVKGSNWICMQTSRCLLKAPYLSWVLLVILQRMTLFATQHNLKSYSAWKLINYWAVTGPSC